MRVAKKIVLHFPHSLVDKPIIYHLVKDYDLEFNVLKASVTPEEEGLLVLELSGEHERYDEAIRFLSETGYITPKVGADAAIFNESGEILLMERSDGSGWWLG